MNEVLAGVLHGLIWGLQISALLVLGLGEHN
jgi:hypothetical protein